MENMVMYPGCPRTMTVPKCCRGSFSRQHAWYFPAEEYAISFHCPDVLFTPIVDLAHATVSLVRINLCLQC